MILNKARLMFISFPKYERFVEIQETEEKKVQLSTTGVVLGVVWKTGPVPALADAERYCDPCVGRAKEEPTVRYIKLSLGEKLKLFAFTVSTYFKSNSKKYY